MLHKFKDMEVRQEKQRYDMAKRQGERHSLTKVKTWLKTKPHETT